MYFIGYTFLGDADSKSDTYIDNDSQWTNITLENGTYSRIFISNTYETTSINQGGTVVQVPINTDWTFKTVAHGEFSEDNLSETNHFPTGNIPYSLSDIQEVRIKRREENSNQWVTLFSFPVETKEDLAVHYVDSYTKANTNYTYKIVPVVINAEQIPTYATVHSDFEGLYIVGVDQTYSTCIEPLITRERNHTGISIPTLGSRYPFVIYTSAQNYDSGTASGVFVNVSKGEWDFDSGTAYRDQLNDFLTDGKAKILKDDLGYAYIIGRIDNISEDAGSGDNYVKTTFNWVQIGDINSTADLYNAGLINASPDSW